MSATTGRCGNMAFYGNIHHYACFSLDNRLLCMKTAGEFMDVDLYRLTLKPAIYKRGMNEHFFLIEAYTQL